MFVFQADKFNIYVTYCKNKPDSSQLILEHAGTFFDVSTWVFKPSVSYLQMYFVIFYILSNSEHYVVVSRWRQWVTDPEQVTVFSWSVCVWIMLSVYIWELFFVCSEQEIQKRHGLANSISSYLIKPVQRITKYQLLLKVPRVSQTFNVCFNEKIRCWVQCAVQYSMCVYRSCCPAVKKARVKLRTGWRSCWVCQKEPTMPCTSACWRVQHHWKHKHTHTY